MNWREDIRNVLGALQKFGRKLLKTKRLLLIMVIGVSALFAVVLLYSSDQRLAEGMWHTYANGLFSVKEPRGEAFDEFQLNASFKASLEQRSRGTLIGAFQKTIFTATDEVAEIRHISVFDLSNLYPHFYSTDERVAKSYLTAATPYFAHYDTKRIADIDRHPAMAYKSKVRDVGGYYSMGVVVIARGKAYFSEVYSHYSSYADWQNDQHTYFIPATNSAVSDFTVDDMDSIEISTFCIALIFLAIYILAGALAHRSITRGIVHQGPVYPVVNMEAHLRFQWLASLTVILMIVMLVMLVAFWQFGGANLLQKVAFVVLGLLIYSFNLPTSIHLYKKARNKLA